MALITVGIATVILTGEHTIGNGQVEYARTWEGNRMSETRLRNVLEEIKNRADSIQAYGIRDLALQALSNTEVIGKIEWIPYDSKSPESHVLHLVSNGIWIAIAIHQIDVEDRVYKWFTADGEPLTDATHYATINFPKS